MISLFSGAGGLDYGFEAAGYATRVTLEYDSDCCKTLRHNRKWPVLEGDICATSTQRILEAGRLKVGEADVLIGGPPCQPFSKSGYWAKGDALRLDDPRARTLAEYLRVVREALPKVFLLENVAGISYSGKDEGLRLVLEAIEQINKETDSNYRASYAILSAADFGVPQLRTRFFLIAARSGVGFDFPAPTHGCPDEGGALFPRQLLPYKTAWDALGDDPPPPEEALSPRGKWADLLASIPEGQNYLYHTDRGEGLPLFGWRRRFWNFLLKLSKDRPSWTIQAQPGPAVGPFHWDSRYLSERELCRLQTFPEDVSILGNRRAVQRQLGNAVPSLLAEVLAREIRVQLLGRRLPRKPLQLLPPRRGTPPSPAPVLEVPAKFRALAGPHSAHPGTGKGRLARTRVSV